MAKCEPTDSAAIAAIRARVENGYGVRPVSVRAAAPENPREELRAAIKNIRRLSADVFAARYDLARAPVQGHC